MGREKVKLAYIQKDSTRRATFRKRKNGLLKKLSELATLCGARICAIVFGENNHPAIWPADAQEVWSTIDELNEFPENERGKRTIDEESFLRLRIEKLRGQLDKLRKANSAMELEQKLIDAMTNGGILRGARSEEVEALKSMVDAKYYVIRERHALVRAPLQPPLPPFYCAHRPSAPAPVRSCSHPSSQLPSPQKTQ